MCGRPLAFRQVRHLDIGLCPFVGRSPEFIMKSNGSAERFRTSNGIAGSQNYFSGKTTQNLKNAEESKRNCLRSPRTSARTRSRVASSANNLTRGFSRATARQAGGSPPLNE